MIIQFYSVFFINAMMQRYKSVTLTSLKSLTNFHLPVLHLPVLPFTINKCFIYNFNKNFRYFYIFHFISNKQLLFLFCIVKSWNIEFFLQINNCEFSTACLVHISLEIILLIFFRNGLGVLSGCN